MLPGENLSADPIILKKTARRVHVDPGVDAEHRSESYAPVDAAEAGARERVMENPGRYPGALVTDRLSPHDTPYRSRVFVNSRHSADGNSYGVGDPCTGAEARRQAEDIFGEQFVPIVETVSVIEAPLETETGPLPVVNPGSRPVGELIPTVGDRVEKPREQRVTCTKCEGHGKSPKMVKMHGPEIGHCPGCRACSRCGGSGYLPKEGEVE